MASTVKSQQEVIKKFMASLDNTTLSGTAALNEAVKYASGGKFASITKAINQMVEDCKTLGADDFLLNKCGIILDNADTGAIIGSDAGGSTTKTKDSIIPESGNLDTSFKETSFKTKNGLTFRLGKTTKLTSDETYIWQALKTWWAEESLSLIKKSYGYSFNDDDATIREINVLFTNEPKASYMAYTNHLKKTNGDYTLTLTINKAFFNKFSSSDVNGVDVTGEFYLDRIIAHELTHAIMMAKVNDYEELPPFITEGLGELTQGSDDSRGEIIKKLAANSNKLENTLDLTAKIGNYYSYAGGYMFLRYLAKQVTNPSSSSSNSTTDNSKNVTVKGSVLTVSKNYSDNAIDLSKYSSSIKTVNATALSKSITIIGNKNANSITAGKGNDTLRGGKGNDTLEGNSGKDLIYGEAGNDKLYGGAGADTLYGDAGNDLLYGEAGNDKLYGGAGADTLWGGKGNDTLYGEAGNDTFIYSSGDGKDVIYGFEKNDLLQITGTFSASYNKSKKELAFKVGSTTNAITLKDFTATTCRINSTTYKIDGTTLVKK